MDELIGQATDAFSMPYYELGSGDPRYISSFVVAISGRFTANAKEKIVYKLPKGALAQCSSSIVSQFSNSSTGTGELPNLTLVAPREAETSALGANRMTWLLLPSGYGESNSRLTKASPAGQERTPRAHPSTMCGYSCATGCKASGVL